MKKINQAKAIQELTLILMYLTRFNEIDRFSTETNLSWKAYDFDVMNELEQNAFIYPISYRSKKVVITEKGLELAQDLLVKYNIDIPN